MLCQSLGQLFQKGIHNLLHYSNMSVLSYLDEVVMCHVVSTEVKLGVLLFKNVNFLNSKWRHDDVIMLFWQYLQFWSYYKSWEQSKVQYLFLKPGFYSRKPNT